MEGTERFCKSCKKKVKGEKRFWIITKFEKEIPSFQCPKCDSLITIELIPQLDLFRIEKKCNCTLELSKSLLSSVPLNPYRKKFYLYCEKCFKKLFPNLLFSELGEQK